MSRRPNFGRRVTGLAGRRALSCGRASVAASHDSLLAFLPAASPPPAAVARGRPPPSHHPSLHLDLPSDRSAPVAAHHAARAPAASSAPKKPKAYPRHMPKQQHTRQHTRQHTPRVHRTWCRGTVGVPYLYTVNVSGQSSLSTLPVAHDLFGLNPPPPPPLPATLHALTSARSGIRSQWCAPPPFAPRTRGLD